MAVAAGDKVAETADDAKDKIIAKLKGELAKLKGELAKLQGKLAAKKKNKTKGMRASSTKHKRPITSSSKCWRS